MPRMHDVYSDDSGTYSVICGWVIEEDVRQLSFRKSSALDLRPHTGGLSLRDALLGG